MVGNIELFPNIHLDVNQLIEQVDGSVVGSVFGTLKDIWEYVFIGIHYSSEEKKLKYENNLKLLSSQIHSNFEGIDPQNLQDPKVSIVGPALEASKYYISEPELRSMFANLISAAADSSLNGKVRASFTEIVKQLEPIDAKVLEYLYQERETPTVEYRNSNKDSGSFNIVLTNVF
ncbi:MAG: DUF4393 domain-containing protein [Tissierellia bacterium]|nr:DUF4393 domain-containing protein [Tissierellia bacterium]